MKTVEIFDEDNSILIDDQYSSTTIDFFPAEKKFTINSSIKDDCFYNHQIIEYKISANPIEIYTKTTELSHEPPKEYSVKDGVVLESEIIKEKEGYFLEEAKKRVVHLKKDVEWSKIDIFGNCEINLFILSKHPEIISKEDFRKFLRQSTERIKMGVLKVEAVVKENVGVQITPGDYGQSIWFPSNESEKIERGEYHELPEEKRRESKYGKKIEHVEKITKSLFTEPSEKYCGISENEFQESSFILKHVEHLLNKKESRTKEPNEKISKIKGIIISLILTLFISWVVSWFVDINPFLIFILVQVISFVQSIIGGWLGKFFE